MIAQRRNWSKYPWSSTPTRRESAPVLFIHRYTNYCILTMCLCIWQYTYLVFYTFICILLRYYSYMYRYINYGILIMWLYDSLTIIYQYDFVTVWWCDSVPMWLYDYMTVWLCDYMTASLCNSVATWQCGYMTVDNVTVCLCDYGSVWLCDM